jgi:signal peptidase I
MTRSRRLRIFSSVAALSVVGVLWLLFAPSQIGGRVDYVIIRGVSMEPLLHSGDLAVLHRQDTYSVGDVVGYKSGLLHAFVLHRIVAKKGNHFLFKGDHNNFVDSYVATKQDLSGRLWFDIPQGGVPVRWLHVPLHAGLLGGLVALLALSGGGATAARRRRRTTQGSEASERFARPTRDGLSGFEDGVWPIAAPTFVAIGFAMLAVAAFTHSGTRIVSDPTAYLQTGAYSYSSIVPASSAYPDGVVRSTDPIYAGVVQRLRVAIHYRFSSALPHSVGGMISLQANVRNADGWRSLLANSPPRRINGDTAAAALTVDTRHLYDQIRAFAHDTGITNDSFSLEVVPTVTLHGSVAGRPISHPTALAPLTFTVSPQSLAVAQQPSVAGAAGAATTNPLATEQPGRMDLPVPAQLTLLKLRIGVERAKEIGIAGVALAFLVGLTALYLASKRRRDDELTRILRRYSAWIIAVESPLIGPKVVDISSMEDLVRLAEHYERAILHEEQQHAHVFALEEDGTLFRYRLGTGEPLRGDRVMTLVEHVPVTHPTSSFRQ